MDHILLLLSGDFLDKPLWMWGIFFVLVSGLLAFDLGVFHRKDHVIEVRESLLLSGFYISIGLLFSLWVWWSLGQEPAINYLTGFVVEKTLAMDNIFVIAMIFSYMQIPRMYQHRVLVWGIMGAIILRGIMIGLGAAIVHEFEWILYIFAAFLIFTGVKMLMAEEKETDISQNAVLKFMHKYFRITDQLHGHDFFAREICEKTGKALLCLTPLFVAMVMIEIADAIFAVDSIPAIFAITTDPYIVYTSNIFAILGLRALYFALAAMIERFVYLKYALSVVLIFIGSKVFAPLLLDIEKFPPLLSLAVTILILVVGIGVSLWKPPKERA